MSDGNTALPVSPVTKEEAMNLSTLFSKAAQAVVAASEYPAQVEALRQQVDKLSQDLSSKTIHSEELERTLHEVRAQRDEARSEITNLKSHSGHLEFELGHANRVISEQQNKVDDLSTNIDNLKRERDEYGMQVLALEEQVASWKGKAEAARAKLADMASLFKPDEPEAAPAAMQPNPEQGQSDSHPTSTTWTENLSLAQPVPLTDTPSQSVADTQTGQPAHQSIETVAGAEATSDASPPSPRSRRYLAGWQSGAMWDDTELRYYILD